jgi:hypothetical protein
MVNDGYVQRPRALAQRQVAPDTVRKMLENLPGQTDAVLISSFGMSYNTFRKIKSGKAVRCSLADCLEGLLRS